MGIVLFPMGRLGGHAERSALRHGLGRLSTQRPPLRVVAQGPGAAFCAACAAPLDAGTVWRGGEAFCSVECSLGGDRPA